MNKKEKNSDIGGIRFVNGYKYLGLTFNKAFVPSPHLDILETKIKRFKSVCALLRH